MSNSLTLPAGQASTGSTRAILLTAAQEFAWSLATSLMACVTLFRSDTGYGAMPTAEFDGAPESVLHVYDPFED